MHLKSDDLSIPSDPKERCTAVPGLMEHRDRSHRNGLQHMLHAAVRMRLRGEGEEMQASRFDQRRLARLRSLRKAAVASSGCQCKGSLSRGVPRPAGLWFACEHEELFEVKLSQMQFCI